MAQRVWYLARRLTHWQASVCYYKQLVQEKNDAQPLSGSRTAKTHFPSNFLHKTLLCQWQAYASFYLQPNQILHHSDNVNLTTCPSSVNIDHDSLSQTELVSTIKPAGTTTNCNHSVVHCSWHELEQNPSRLLSFSHEKACHPTATTLYPFLRKRCELQDTEASAGHGAGPSPETLNQIAQQLRCHHVSTLDRTSCRRLGPAAATRFCGLRPGGLHRTPAPRPSCRAAAARLQQLLPRRQQHGIACVLQRSTRDFSVRIPSINKLSISALQRSVRLGGGGRRQLHDGGARRRAAAGGGPSGSHTTKMIHGSFGSYNFDVTKPLGEGNYGEVYLGENATTGQPVAIKTIMTTAILSTDTWGRICITREISALMQMRHPHIVYLYDVVFDPSQQWGDRLYLVMELMSGGDLLDLVMGAPGRLLPEDEARRFFQQLIQAVTFCHNAQIFHRDLKPGNLLMDASKLNLKVADFGLSAVGWQGAANPLGQLHSGVGTVSYMAPEVLENWLGMAKPYHGAPADLWSCGVILYFLLSGKTPFGGNEGAILSGTYSFPPHFSQPVRDILTGMLEMNPDKRATSEQIYDCPWFRVGFQPVDYRDLPGVQDNLDVVNNLMRQPVDPARTEDPPADHVAFVLPRAPRRWVHRDEPIDNFTFGYGQAHDLGPNLFLRDDVLMFYPVHETTKPQMIVRYVKKLCDDAGYRVETRNYNLTVWEQGEVPPWKLREPLCVIIDIITWPPPHKYMVYFRRVTGSAEVFDDFVDHIVDNSSSFMTPHSLP